MFQSCLEEGQCAQRAAGFEGFCTNFLQTAGRPVLAVRKDLHVQHIDLRLQEIEFDQLPTVSKGFVSDKGRPVVQTNKLDSRSTQLVCLLEGTKEKPSL